MKKLLNKYVKFVAVLCSLLALSSTASFALAGESQEVHAGNPYLLINDVADVLFSDLALNRDKYREQPELLKTLVEEKLLIYINYKYAAYKVLGSALKKSKKEERLAFVDAFRTYLVTSYASVLTLYDDQKFNVEQPKEIAAKTKRVAVQVKVLQAGTEPINLNFKMLKNKKTGEWSTYDLVAEGVSMITTKQQEWQSTLRKKNGIQLLTKKLNKLASAKIEYKAE